VAAALIGQPDLLILDEPTDGIDPIGRSTIRKLIHEESQRGATIFLNSHLLSETERICQRVGVLVNGRLVREGPIDELRRVEHAWAIDLAGAVSESELEALGLERGDEPQTWIYRGPDVGHLNEVIDSIRKSGAHLIALRPEERDLESVLVDAVEQEHP
jgi:ABC-2 type transport system ATP-binding protein